MTIAEVREKCKAYLGHIPRDILLVAIIILASSASFGLGYLAGSDAGQGRQSPLDQSSLEAPGSPGQVVASKSGTKYYPPTCAGAANITDANKVWFVSSSAAEAAGYTPAAHCDGL